MMTLLSCVCSYDRNKRVFIGLFGAQGEKGQEKVIQRWDSIRLGAFVLSFSIKGSLLLCYLVYTAHCCAGYCCLSKHNQPCNQRDSISCGFSLVDAHITLVYYSDENIHDLKRPIKFIWRWISCLRDIFMQARCLKTVVLHDTYWQAGHITVHAIWATESLDLFLLEIYFYSCWKNIVEKEEIDILYHVNTWQWVTGKKKDIYIYLYSTLCFYTPFFHV